MFIINPNPILSSKKFANQTFSLEHPFLLYFPISDIINIVLSAINIPNGIIKYGFMKVLLLDASQFVLIKKILSVS